MRFGRYNAVVVRAGFTPNEVSLIGAFGSVALAGIVLFFVATYTIRRGPNYEKQIQAVYDVLASLANEPQDQFWVRRHSPSGRSTTELD